MAKSVKSGKASAGGGDFENPGQGDGQPDRQESDESAGDGQFEAPSSGDLGAEMSQSETVAIESELGSDLVALKAEVEKKLAGDAKESSASSSVQDVEGSNIVGVGYGYDDAAGSGEIALPPGQAGLVVYTIEKQDASQVLSEISSMAGTRALSTVPIVQVVTGVIDAQPHRWRLRPVPCGISVGHFRITAGTLGCLSVGQHAPRTNRLMVLSNNHVLANSNAGSLGDPILQPGPYDGGRNPQDQIAILERFVPINFAGGVNYVDCATGWAWPDRVRREQVYLSGGAIAYYRTGSVPLPPSIGMTVGKSGRTTQLTSGRITAIGVSVNVNYGGGRVAHFRDQMAIRAPSGNFSAGGDSGSLIWQWATGVRPVGLLYAGGGGTTFANSIARVLGALDIRIYS